jgi:hypothetical protein
MQDPLTSDDPAGQTQVVPEVTLVPVHVIHPVAVTSVHVAQVVWQAWQRLEISTKLAEQMH